MSEPQIPSQQGELPPPASPSPPGDLAPVVRAATRWRGRRWLVGIGLLFIVLTASGLLWLRGSRGPSVPPDRFPLPPLSSSPFRNTGAEAHYVGSESCKSCHQARTASFRRTGMGCSMAEIDPMREPADAVFDHVLSKRRYQVTRKDGQLWHRELLLSGGREEVVLSEYPLRYVVGSGRHARTYVAEAEGFLVESPVTWYASRKEWGMSPGYDQANHQGFERGIGEGCLVCHAGRAQAVGKSLHRITIKEAAIGCERCHGPGSLHVEQHRGHPNGPDNQPRDVDYTIVNPKHLPRELAEAVCQQCHLHSAATVLGRGRSMTDYRPGLPLQDFRQDYGLEVDSKLMTVVGHVEQMHLSRCYKESRTLTCTTCHNPHAFPRPDERVAHHRAICVRCHQPERCTVPHERRRRESPDNDCVQCHMPSAPTDVPHVSFTHHRIAVHDRLPKDQPEPAALGLAAGTLRPFLHDPRLGEVDRERSLGLAFLHAAKEEKQPARAAAYRSQALQRMAAAHAAGLPDPVLEAKLSRLYFEMEQKQALPLAESALRHPETTGVDRCAALFVLAGERLKRNQPKEARAALQELVGLRRHPDDWLVLAECEKALGNRAGFVQALEMAVRIKPGLVQVHQYLAQHYRQQRDQPRAAWHQQRATP